MITQKELKYLLRYEPETGKFYWRNPTAPHIKSGQEAGGTYRNGRCCIRINDKSYLRSRLAWLYVHGYFPENFIDHINRNPSDDRLDNLREATNQCNSRNTGQFKSNTSGIKGVCWHKTSKKWRASINVNGKAKHLGLSTCKAEAAAHRYAAEQCLDWPLCDTDSSAGKYLFDHIHTR